MALRTRLPRATPRRPAESGQRGVLPNTATRKADPASFRGSGGAPSGPVRAAGPSPSIREGIARGTPFFVRAAGVGAGAGLLAVGAGAGKAVYDRGLVGALGPDKNESPGGGAPPKPTLFGTLGDEVGVPGSILGIAVVAGALLLIARRKK